MCCGGEWWKSSLMFSKVVLTSSRKSSAVFLLLWAPLTMLKPLNVWITTNWEILKEMEIPGYLTCLLRNLYADQEGTVRTGNGTMDWFQIGKRIIQGCILSPWLFNLYAEYIIRNARLNESQAGIKIARRNISNLRYANDTILMAGSKEEANWRASWWKLNRRVKNLA